MANCNKTPYSGRDERQARRDERQARRNERDAAHEFSLVRATSDSPVELTITLTREIPDDAITM